MKRVSSGYLPEAEPIKILKVENTGEFEGDLPVEIIKQIISLGSLFLRNNVYLSFEYFETFSLVSKKWFVASNKAAVQFLNSNFDMHISANEIFRNEMRLKNFIKKFGVGLESFIFFNYWDHINTSLFKRNYTPEEIACLANLTTICYNTSNCYNTSKDGEYRELELIAEKCKKIKNVIFRMHPDFPLSNSILSNFEKIESLSISGHIHSPAMKEMAEKFSNLKYLNMDFGIRGNYNEFIKGKFPLLEELALALNTDDENLAQIKDSFPLLKKLSLRFSRVTHLEVISQSFPLLETLDLDGCNVHLAEIKDSYPLLQELHLSNSSTEIDLKNICNSFPLLTRLYLSSKRVILNFEVILNFAKARPKNVNLTIHIEVPKLEDFDIQWKKTIEDLFPHIKLVFISYRRTFSAHFPNKYHYELRS